MWLVLVISEHVNNGTDLKEYEDRWEWQMGDVMRNSKRGVSDPVWVYDNEPRSKEITSRISSTIAKGDSVVIWPSNIHEKDINDMVLAGHDVQSIVESNIYNGLEAKLQFTNWKRI